MKLANEIWRLARDVLLVFAGIFNVVMLSLGKVPPEVAPTLVPLTFGLFALPGWLRSDERKQREHRRRSSNFNGNGNGPRGDDQGDS